MLDKTAVCLVANFKYLYKNFPRMYKQIRNVGKYNGEILVITSLLCPTFLIKFLRKNNNVSILRFKKIKFDKKTELKLSNLNLGSNRHVNKNFQWQKLYLFDKKIKKWNYIFYLDINMYIHHDIRPILDVKPINELLARADGYPNYEWKLSSQFDTSDILYSDLCEIYDMEINNYFQTGVMYFDTKIINKQTFKEIMELTTNYPITITNEQGILNLYFIFVKNNYRQLVEKVNGKISYFYWMLNDQEVIISKAMTTKNK